MTSSNLTNTGSRRKRHVPTKYDHIYFSTRSGGEKVYEVRSPHGNRSYEVVGTLDEAKARANELYAPNAPKITGSVTFEQAVADWQATRQMRPSSQKRLDGIVNKHLLPRIGHMKVRDIDTGSYARVLAAVTPGSAKLTYSCMRIVLAHAVEMGALAVVPKLSRKRTPKAAPSRRRVLSADEQTRLLVYAARFGCLSQVIRVALGQALRIGEVVGLEWDDIDFPGGTMTVRRTVDKTGYVDLPKGGREDVIPLTPMAREALLELRGSSDGTGRVFRNRDGNPWAYSDISRAFNAARDAAALQVTEDGRVTFHTCRHTGISRASNHPAIPLLHVRDFARHTDLTTTQGYMHKIEDKKVASALAEALAA